MSETNFLTFDHENKNKWQSYRKVSLEETLSENFNQSMFG